VSMYSPTCSAIRRHGRVAEPQPESNRRFHAARGVLGEIRQQPPFRVLAWDEEFVYHAVDHGLDGDSNESYMFTNGRWLARYLPANATASAPWTMDVAQNQLVWFDAACGVDDTRSHAFPYRQRAWFEPRRDAGSALGTRDTLVLEYQPYDPLGAAGAAEALLPRTGSRLVRVGAIGLPRFLQSSRRTEYADGSVVWCKGP
jgi:hypothetical protein